MDDLDLTPEELDEMKEHLLELLRKHLDKNESPEPEQ